MLLHTFQKKKKNLLFLFSAALYGAFQIQEATSKNQQNNIEDFLLILLGDAPCAALSREKKKIQTASYRFQRAYLSRDIWG